MPQRALITGVSGFAGGFLAEHLLDCGDVVLGTSPDGDWEAFSSETIRDRVDLVAWELSRTDGLAESARRRIHDFGPEVIYHLAAMSIPRECGGQEPSELAMAVNVEGTQRVLQLAASLEGRPRVVFISSSQVYAPVSAESARVDESAPVGPVTAYGKTKAAAEAAVLAAVQQHGADAVIARAFQHTGPRQNPQLMLPQWARQFATGGNEPVEVYTRDAWIDLTDVRDVVRAYRLLAERGRAGEIVNVGSGTSRRSGDVLEVLQAMADPQRPIVELQPGTKYDPIADITYLRERTDWCATIPMKKTVFDTLSWWRQSGALEATSPNSRKES